MVDAFLEIPQGTETAKCHQDYVDKLKQRMAVAYEAASEEAQKNAERQKACYDEKVRHSTLEVGDRVLVEKKGHKGKHKLADLWEHCPYVVIGQPVPDIPVYEVVRENARQSKPRTLQRNMLQPFTGLPCPRTHKPAKVQKTKQQTESAEEEIDVRIEETEYRDSDESSADEEEIELETPNSPPYIPPVRRGPGQRGLQPRSTTAAAPQKELQRRDRTRRPPEWLRDQAWVRSQYAFRP
ncbi:MAG: hypothetical protein AB2693_27355 [Candidatus Thiodiazotropha sp.]